MPAEPGTPSVEVDRVKKLNADELQQLIAGYRAGATVYELGTQFGIKR